MGNIEWKHITYKHFYWLLVLLVIIAIWEVMESCMPGFSRQNPYNLRKLCVCVLYCAKWRYTTFE